MEKHEVISPDPLSWQSPENCPASTPDNDGSSRQDSGYSSTATPCSARSPSPYPASRLSCICNFCRKPVVGRNQSTPVSLVCTCQKVSSFKLQSPFECLTTIREGKITSSPPPFWPKRSLELDDDSIDASLYPENEPGDGPKNLEVNDGSINTMDISDEASINFVEKMFALPSSSAIFDTMDIESGKNFNGDLMVVPKTEKLSSVANASKSPIISLVKEPVLSYKTKKTKKLTFMTVLKRVHRATYVLNAMKRTSLIGKERVDFLSEFTETIDCFEIIEQIFSNLSEKDLNRVTLVSKLWKACVEKDRVAFERLNVYKTKMLLRKENYSSPAKVGSGNRAANRQTFGVLAPITNLRQSPASPPRRSPPLSPSSQRHRHARQVASTMKKGERSLKCPRCAFLVADHGLSPSAKCRRSGCRHRFCIYCKGEVGGSGPPHCCPPLLTPRSANKTPSKPTKIHPVGSKNAVRNLRRTLI